MSIGGITSIIIRSCLSKLVPPNEIGKSFKLYYVLPFHFLVFNCVNFLRLN